VDVPGALEPLYRNYLRRLDEMVSRIGEEAALREATVRGADGSVVLSAEGLPRRFDVASSTTSETFEVHGAHPDEPAARDLVAGHVPVRIEPGNWESLPVACGFAGEPRDEDAAALADLLRSWAFLAGAGGFAVRRPPDAVRWSGRLHSIAVSLRGPEVVALLDLGTCPPAAFEPLLAAIGDFGRERAPIGRVLLGGPPY
jgi:hypothetical protein